MTTSGARRVVIMGVSGLGKTTVGSALAARLGWRFIDADALHPPANTWVPQLCVRLVSEK
jgi:gluconokinase